MDLQLQAEVDVVVRGGEDSGVETPVSAVADFADVDGVVTEWVVILLMRLSTPDDSSISNYIAF